LTVHVIQTALPGVLVLEPRVFRDERGWFFESYNRRTLAAIGIDAEMVQDNCSRSKRDVLRGLHYQIQHAQGKLVRVLAGEVLDVTVDLRKSSAFFGKWTHVALSAESQRMLWVPPGFAHGFVVRSESADVLYKTTDFWSPEHERTIAWDDPDLAIDWGVAAPLLSAKDARGTRFRDAEVFP
jgi:dTDP-4-dehydrorhamnose 3,5-epimerase